MSKIVVVDEVAQPSTPPAGRHLLYAKAAGVFYVGSDGVEHFIGDVDSALAAHEGDADPHPQYLSEGEADLLYSPLNHNHNVAQLVKVSKTPWVGEYGNLTDALAYAATLTPSSTNRIVIEVAPGEYTEAPFTLPAYVYLVGKDPWGAAHIKTNDNANDFITIAPNGGMFNFAITGPTDANKSGVVQVASGTTKAYWLNFRGGWAGITLKPASGTARCHALGVVTDGVTAMNRLFNADNPTGVAVFILMQSGPMSSSGLSYGVYLNGTTAFATLDMCQFRISGSTAVYADAGATVKGIATTFAGGSKAIHVGPNGATKVDVHGSVIKSGAYTDDIKIDSPTAVVSFSGYATESKITVAAGAQFFGSFADASSGKLGQVILGELWVGNKDVQTPLASYIQADKNTGLVTGGGLSRGTGRVVNVDAGEAFIDTPSGLKDVTWGATALTITANTAKARIYVDSSGTVQQSATGVDKTLNVQLGECGTDSDSVLFLFDQTIRLPHFRPRLYEYLEKVIGPINAEGGVVTVNGTNGLAVDVSASTFFVTEEELVSSAATAATFFHWHRDGSGGWIVADAVSEFSPDHYDDGSGTLATLPTGKYIRSLLYVAQNSGGTEFHVVCSQGYFDSEVEADTNPLPPDVLVEHACRLAAIVLVEGATSITSIIDQRPRLGQMASASTGVTNHNDLAGRDSTTAHSQYQLGSEKGNPDGYASLDGTGKVPSAQLPAIAHGDLGGGSLHSVATGATAGFMSASDKSKLDGIATGATANSSDATLLARANHTGEQAISTVTGLQTALDTKMVGSRQTCVKISDYGMSSTTPGDVPEMSVTLEANTSYNIHFDLVYRSANTGTGISFSLNGPATPTVLAYRKIIPTSATAAAITTANTYSVHQPSATTTAANADQFASLDGVIVTGATGGTLTLRVSSESNGVGVTVRQGSVGLVEKL